MSIIYQEVISGIVSGVSGKLIHVEVETRNGLPYFTMVGYLSKESMEAKERVASALRSIGHPLPSMKITVNLSPANIRKNGTAFDFPIAVAFLGCLNLIDASKLDDICIMGELGLNGKIRGVGNCLPIVLEARKQGIHKFFAASEDENSLRGIEDIEVVLWTVYRMSWTIFMEHIIKKVAEVQQLIKRKSQKKTSVISSDNNI